MSAAAAVAACLGLAVYSPLWTALLLPLLLGVPHAALGAAAVDLAAGEDESFLRGLAPILAALSLLSAWALYEPAARWLPGLAGAVAVAVGAGGGRRAMAWGAPLCAAAVLSPSGLTLLLAHGHNLLAVAAWAWTAGYRGGRRPRLAPALCAAAAAAILAGAFDAAIFPWRDAAACGLTWRGLEGALAPGLPEAWAGRLVLCFVFLQTVHYAAWLWLTPRELGGWRRIVEAARARWGRAPAWAAAAAAALVPAAGLVDAAGTRDAYLALVAFHGWLELAGAARLSSRA